MRQYLPLATESETFAAEEYGLWAEVGTGLMQEHR
jgi:hypothetical protein